MSTGRAAAPRRATSCTRAVVVASALAASAGCMMGPDYARPSAPTADAWLNAADTRVESQTEITTHWWTVFQDPILVDLVETAYAQNPSLQAAGLRVIEAQARRAIAIGNIFPQTQTLHADETHSVLSENRPFIGGTSQVAGVSRGFDTWTLGFDVAWEVDLWGKFRRGIEASDADLLASLASYDDVLTSLVAQVASTYVQARVLEQRLAIAEDNLTAQRESMRIADIRYQAGGTSNLDVQQAATLLHDTQATVPLLVAQLHQTADLLSVLLGRPPQELEALLGEPGPIPAPPPTVAVGIPATLLERRPDVRQAERAAAAQSARIGVAFTDLLPRLQLAGSVGLSAEDAMKLLEGRAFQAEVGPRFDWPVLNYGRIINNVRLQDATFQELLATYVDTVLRAQQEVEDALAGYLRGLERVARLEESVTAAGRAVDLSLIQYREGAADFTRVLDSQTSKLREDDLLAQSRGDVAQSVVSLYRALGGGWELRDGQPLISQEAKDAMQERTWYGGMLGPDEPAAEIDDAKHGTEPGGASRWRFWRPRW